VGVVIFINPTTRLTDGEVSTLERFVTSGGGLLVLGDHTDIGGSKEPLNTVLSFTAIRFNFDSAMPLRKHWQGCLETRRHPVTRSTHGEVMLQMGIGASLEIEEPAFPVVVARYGFSDAGDPLNGGMGAYMGNGRHETGEGIGDIVVVAGQCIGRGRVVTFGDTSPFQNSAMLLSRQLVSDVVTWLGACRDEKSVYSLADSACLSADEDNALIDFSLRPLANLELFTGASLGGLANCLVRAGVSAICAFSSDQWQECSTHLFLINPTRSPTDLERQWLLDYIATGGNLIVSKGYVSPQPCRNLLSNLGFSIKPVPLGGGDARARISHKDAWWVAYGGEADTSVLATAFGYPTVVNMRLGDGTVTMIGDGRLLLDENLEGEFDGNLDNMRFVVDLAKELGSGRQRAIVPRH
jgi:hypothetical protein